MGLDRILIAAVVAALGAGVSNAADLPARNAPAAPVLAADWTGFYFGLNGGYARAASSNSFRVFSTTLLNFPSITDAVDGAGSQSMSEPGGVFGAQAGYLWEASNL
jgi:outer membrane immunogenic protein